MKHPARKKRKAQVKRIWEKHYPNITVEKVAKMMGLSYRTIYRYLQETGCTLPPKSVRRIDMNQVKRAHELFDEHGQKTKVAQIMKMSYSQIRRYLNINPQNTTKNTE